MTVRRSMLFLPGNTPNIIINGEALGADEYVADLYDAEKPLTVNLKETEKGFELLAAAEMLFDEEMDGWYMGERVEDAEMVERALRNAMNDGRA